MSHALAVDKSGSCHYAWLDAPVAGLKSAAFRGRIKGWVMCQTVYYSYADSLKLSEGPVTCLECLAGQNDNGIPR